MTLQEIQTIFNSSKYGILYTKIVQKSFIENRIKLKKDSKNYIYYEAHHILPKSLFPDYSDLRINKWNRSLLTAREHFICHILLMKHYRKISNKLCYQKMSKAITSFKMKNTYNSKLYELIKLNLKTSDETKLKISNKMKNRIFSEEHKLKLSEATKGHSMSEESKNKMKATLKGTRSGSKNSRAKTIKVYDTNNIIRYVVNGGFSKLCKDNNLPYSPLMTSYRNEGSPIYSSKQAKTTAKRLGLEEYIGWYAVIY